MRLYLSGSITGVGTDQAKRIFNGEKSRLEHAGYEVVSPLDYPPAVDISWVSCIQRDIGLVASSDGVALIDDSPNTQFSHGVAIEKHVAQYLQLPVMSVSSWVENHIDGTAVSTVDPADWHGAEAASAQARRL
jgi:hypothetical protein